MDRFRPLFSSMILRVVHKGRGRSPRRMLGFIAASQLMVLSLWFSATAVSPVLIQDWGVSTTQAAWLTLGVQVGFVMGAFGSALLNLADLVPARVLFGVAATLASVANGLLILLGPEEAWLMPKAVGLRLAVGVCLAFVYPAGLKVVSGWYQEGRGMALGILVGALTLGSALPHLVRGLGLPWQQVLLVSSGLALLGALLMGLFVRDGPFETQASPFSWTLIGEAIGNRGVRLSTYGYLGHMWELYAMWSFTAAFLVASAKAGGHESAWVPVATFSIIAVGGLGSWWAGLLADRLGKGPVAAAAMALSGACALVSPLVFGRAPWLMMALFLIWGLSVVADSAQFSAIVSDEAEAKYRGTALTLQTALGFLVTLVTLWAVPAIAAWSSWRWAFPLLALGPGLGMLAMWQLQRGRKA